eukprot:Ihof_evm12s58 gene=Ihof_evmTU12s58
MTENNNKRKRFCSYNRSWETKYPWLTSVLDDSKKAECSICCHKFSISHQGEGDVKRHLLTESHKKKILVQTHKIKAAVLTVSDSCYVGAAQDTSGPALRNMLIKTIPGCDDVITGCVRDDIYDIQQAVIQWVDHDHVDLLLTTGGTGFGPRDVTPQAILPLLDRVAPAMSTCMTVKSLEVTPLAMLSRPVSGMRKSTLIATLPGSRKGAEECLGFLLPAIPHALHLLKDDHVQIANTHSNLQAPIQPTKPLVFHNLMCPHKAGSLGAGIIPPIAHRPRTSPYPMLTMEVAVPLVMDHAPVLPTMLMSININLSLLTYMFSIIASDGVGDYTVLAPVNAGDSLGDIIVVPGTVARITTGAPVPVGADAVVQVEDTELVEADAVDGNTEMRIRIKTEAKVGQDIRPIGYDITVGETVLHQGERLGGSELGLLATVGVSQVAVHRRPLVGVLSTGNELQLPGTSRQDEKIYDSNKVMLMSMVTEAGADVIDLGIAADTRESLEERLRSSLDMVDIIISTGGVSMGERDLVKCVLEDQLEATIHFGRVFMKPGKPTTFATIEREAASPLLVFGLPGNPVSAAVTFHLFVHPVIRKMAGYPKPALPTVDVKLGFNASLDPRPEYQRSNIQWDSEISCFVANTTGSQCSSRLL